MIDEYEALRKEKRRCAEEGTLTDKAETEIALCLGRLFCYSTRRSIVKDIDLNIVVGAPTREECENKMHILIEDFRGWIEAVGREVLAD